MLGPQRRAGRARGGEEDGGECEHGHLGEGGEEEPGAAADTWVLAGVRDDRSGQGRESVSGFVCVWACVHVALVGTLTKPDI